MPESRTGASTRRSGASAPTPTSKRTWSLPLPVQPCATIAGAVPRGRGDESLDDHRPGQRGDQRVAVHVERAGAQRGQAEPAGELVAQVEHLGLDGAAGERALADHVQVLAALADVGGHGDHLGAGPLGDPADRHGGVQAAGVGQDDTLGHGTPRSRGGCGLLGARRGARAVAGPGQGRAVAAAASGGSPGRLGRPRGRPQLAGDHRSAGPRPRRGGRGHAAAPRPPRRRPRPRRPPARCHRRRWSRARRQGRPGRSPRRGSGRRRAASAAPPGCRSPPPRRAARRAAGTAWAASCPRSAAPAAGRRPRAPRTPADRRPPPAP